MVFVFVLLLVLDMMVNVLLAQVLVYNVNLILLVLSVYILALLDWVYHLVSAKKDTMKMNLIHVSHLCKVVLFVMNSQIIVMHVNLIKTVIKIHLIVHVMKVIMMIG